MKKGALFISQINSGGAEHVVSRLTYILKNEYDLDVIIFENMGMSYPIECNVINMNIPAEKNKIKKIWIFLKRISVLKKIKKERKYDFVISFLDTPNFVNILSNTKKCKNIVSIRNYSMMENKKQVLGGVTNKAIRFLYNKADAIISVTDLIAKSYINDYKISPNKLFTIYNPYDISEIQRLSQEPTELCVKKEQDTIAFVTMGRQMYQKGYWHLLKAFSILEKKFPNIMLYMIGEDYQDGKVEKMVMDLGLSKKVILTGQLKNPFPIISQCDCYILTSLFEGFPNALVEAMVCGLPVIAADCKSGPREILFSKPDLTKTYKEYIVADYGILTPELESEENWKIGHITKGEMKLASSMEMIVSDKELREDMAQKAFEGSKRFSYEVCKDRYCKVVNTVVE